MNDDFEDSLRDSLRRATQAAPDEPTRSEGARAYAASVRRRRTGVLAVGAAAVVVAAITIVPTVLDRSDGRGDPVAGRPQTQTPQQPVELPDQPFECPSGDGPPKPMATPPDGTIAPGAALVRVCAAQDSPVPWAPPLDALTTDVDKIVSTVNGLPVARDKMACTEEAGPAYLMVFQYSDGGTVQVRGDVYGCQLVSFGALEREGAGKALEAYFDVLTEQRSQQGPPPAPSLPTLSCPGSTAMNAATLIPQDLSHLTVEKASVCSYDGSGQSLSQGVLSPAEADELSADLQAHSTGGVVDVPCPAVQSQTLLVRNDYGDVVSLQKYCEIFLVAEQVWTPTGATLDMLRAALR